MEGEELTLDQKMQRFRDSQGETDLLSTLTTQEKKQLSSKYLYALEKSGNKDEIEASQKHLTKGLKQKAHQEVVRSFVLHGGFNEAFMHHFKSLSFQKTYVEKDRPQQQQTTAKNNKQLVTDLKAAAAAV